MRAVDEDDLKRLLEANSMESRRHFDVTAERLENKIQLVAETVSELDQKFDRRIDGLEERFDRGFVETQAMTSGLVGIDFKRSFCSLPAVELAR